MRLEPWDDPEGWYGEGGGRRVQDGFRVTRTLEGHRDTMYPESLLFTTRAPAPGTREDTQLPSTLPSLRCQENAGSHSLRDLRISSWSSRNKGREAGHRLRLHGLLECCWNQGTKSEPHSPAESSLKACN